MPSTNIRIPKTTKPIKSTIDDPVITEQMSEAVTEICKLLLGSSSEFKFKEEEAFSKIYQYIKTYKRLLYSQISNEVYACFSEHTMEEASNLLGTMISNIENLVAYTGTPQYKKERDSARRPEDKKAFVDTEKALIKIWDHVNLAQTQYNGLKQTDEEYKKKFDKSITPFKEALVKDMNAQLLTMVSIFTALAFLVFGGISSLGNVFSNHTLPLLKTVIIGCVWGLCLLNLVFVFLFCIGKMTGLSLKPDDEPDANLIQKYPIVWWSNLLLLTLLSGTLWTYYIRSEDLDAWFIAWSHRSPRIAAGMGFTIILIGFLSAAAILLKFTWKKRK